MAYGKFPWGVKSELQLLAFTTATATPDPSCINDLHFSHSNTLQQQILNPLNKARDHTFVLMDTSQFRHFGSSTTTPKNLQHRKSRSKDYDVYSDNDICGQESEDNFAKELQQYIQAKEKANVTQSLSFPEESAKKEGAKNTQKAIKQKNKNKNLKAIHKNGKQKKMKRKWPDTAEKGSSASLRSNGSQEQDGKPKEKQQPVRMSQGFINQHTVQRQGKQICKYFLERKCIKGDQCKFDHDAEIEKKKEMCKFYVQGYCTRGENCLYLHNEYPCKFYHTGAKCYQGEYCKFSHAPLTAETQELLAKVLDPEKKSS